jgi:hypothetical protein
MLRLEKPVRDPENTTLKAPASKNLCNVRVHTMILAALVGVNQYKNALLERRKLVILPGA